MCPGTRKLRARVSVWVVCAALGCVWCGDAQAQCPRTVELIVHTIEGPELEADEFAEAFAGVFGDAGVGFATGQSEPEYVLAVTYETFQTDDGATHTCLSVTLGYVDGKIGGASFRKAPCGMAAYYGEFVYAHGSVKEGTDLSAFDEVMAEAAAEFPLQMAAHEQIPDSVDAGMDRACFKEGESAKIRLINIHEPYSDPLLPSNIQDRLVATVHSGAILNGVPLAGDPLSCVFTVPARRSGDDFVEIQYQAPRDGASDQLTVYNSCDILSSKPLESTEVGALLLTLDLPSCGQYILEYNHNFTIEHGEAFLDYTMTGKVPLRVTYYESVGDDGKAGEIRGEGTVSIMMAGSFRECSVTYASQMNVVVGGEVRLEYTLAGYERKLQVTLEESYGVVGGGAMVDCPDEEPFFTGGVWAPPVTQGQEARLIFNDRDGDTITRPFEAAGASGDAKWVLHAPAR